MNPMDFLNFNSQNFIPNLVIVITVVCLILLLLREVRTWYWKQNEIVSLLKKIEQNTRKPVLENKPEIEAPVAVRAEEKLSGPMESFKIKSSIDSKKIHLVLKISCVILLCVGIAILAFKMVSYMAIGRF